MKVKFSRCTSSNLAEVPQVDGQLIYTKDTNEVYLDVGNNRNKISDVIMVANKSGVVAPVLNKLYYETSTDTLFKAKIENNTIVWVDITGATIDYVDNNFLKKDNTTAYTPTQNYHPATKKYVDDNCIPYQPFPAGLDTSHTTLNFITSIRALNLPAGSTYLGGVTLTDMPFVGNAEVEIYVYPNNVIYLTLRSANISPYMWECNSHTFRGWEAIDKTAKDYANTNFLKKDNMTAYTPTGDYNPATKQYIDVRYERLKSTLPTTTGTGQDVTLNKTAELEFVKPPLPMGNSEQVQYSGKQLIPFTNQDFTLNGVRHYVQNGTLYLNGTTTTETNQRNELYKSNFSMTLLAGTYYFKRGTSNIPMYIIKYDDDTNIVTNEGQFTLEETTQVYFGIYLYQKTLNNEKIDCQLELGNSATSYEPYTFGQAPNPNFEVPITNVTGDVEVVVENKNLFDISKVTWGKYNVYNNQSGNYANAFIAYINVQKNKQISISTKYEVAARTSYQFLDKNNNVINGVYQSINKKEYAWTNITVPENATQLLISQLDCPQANNIEIQVEYNTTPITYVAHKDQTFTFPLGNEKLMLGDYLADDGKHHVREQRVFDGTENFLDEGGFYSLNISNMKSANVGRGLCTHYLNFDIYDNTKSRVRFGWGSTKIYFYDLQHTTLTEFKTFLAEQYQNETPIIVEYELEQEVIVPYTSAQQTVYNAIKQALSYEGQTNISSNQNAIFNVEAYLGTKIILTNYVKKTDYAKEDVGGLIKTGNGFSATSNGYLTTSSYTYPEYITKANAIFIGKGTLETIISSSILKTGSTAPTTSTVGYRVGQLYLNTADNKLYQLTSIDGTDPNNIIYNWQQIINNADLANTVGQINSVLDSINGVEV